MSKKKGARSDDAWVGSFAGKPSLAQTQTGPRRRPMSGPTKILVFLMLVLSLIGMMLLSGYLNAEDIVLPYTQSTDTVTVEEGDGALVYRPVDGTAKTGLIFYPAAKVEHEAYAPMMQMLAEQGVFCVLVEMPLRLAALEPSAASHFIEGYPEIAEWYVGGHAMGGAMAAGFAADHAASLKGVLLLAASSDVDLSGTALKVLSVTADKDTVMDREAYETALANLPSTAQHQEIAGGNHAGFGCYGELEDDGWAEIEPLEQQRQTAALVAAWVAGE